MTFGQHFSLVFTGEESRRLVVFKAKAAELLMSYLVGGNDLEPGKVLVLVAVVLHKRGKEDIVTFRRSIVGRRPPNSFVLQFVNWA